MTNGALAIVPEMRISIFDQYGIPLDSIDAKAPRSWILNDIGQCVFTLSSANPHCTEKNLRFGNLIFIQSAGLPSWVGVIDTPRGRNYGSITVTAYSAEYLLKLRTMQRYPSRTQQTAGDAVIALINDYNEYGGTPIQTNVIDAGPQIILEQTITSVYDALKKLSDVTAHDFDITAYLDDNNVLNLVANWYYQKGKVNLEFAIDESNSVLVDDNGVEEQGPFYNVIVGCSSTASVNDRQIIKVQDNASVARYGPRNKFAWFPTTNNAYILTAVTSMLNNEPTPAKRFNLAIDNNNSAWSKIGLGDIVLVHYSWGCFYNGDDAINSYVKIIGVSVEEKEGKMVFTAAEVYYDNSDK